MEIYNKRRTKMKSVKGYRLNYQLTHKKLENAIRLIIKENGILTVKSVAKRVGVCESTAFNHKCSEMILELLKEYEEAKEREK